jgi:hypothetical protein
MAWFEVLFGFKESPASVKLNFTVEAHPDRVVLVSKINQRKFNAGLFSLRNIASFGALPPASSPGTFHVIHGQGGRGPNSEICSVLESQGLPEFDGATFQAASNFNGLEFCGPGETARMGVSRYVNDPTQGPYCALAAGAALVYRNYFVKHADGTVGQLEKEIELLGGTPIGPFVSHGYPRLSANDLSKLKGHNWKDHNQFLVALHENCEVTTRSKPGLGIVFDGIPPGQIVHHVYAAAFCFSGTVTKNKTSLMIAQELLTAEYHATILAAREMARKYPGRRGSGRLVLTALGGGVFGNPRELIVKAIVANTEVIRESGLQVYFVCYNTTAFQDFMNAGLKGVMESLQGRVVASKEEL